MVATTGADGRYVLRGLDDANGPATVCFYPRFARGPARDGYLPECHENKPDEYSADPVAVTNGGTTTLPTTVLAAAGSISGRLTLPDGSVGGAHAGYRVYPCKDGRVAVAALEPHFAAALCDAAQVPVKDMRTLFHPATHAAIAAFLAGQTRKQLDKLAVARDIPLHTLPR